MIVGFNRYGDDLLLDGTSYKSRLILGTGKYPNFDIMKAAIEASGCEIITVAVRRVNIEDTSQPMLQDYLDPKKYVYLPNTAGCYTAQEAVRTLQIARELGGWNLVKLEVLGDEKTLYPNVIETIKATQQLVAEGFRVMVYTSDDLIVAKELASAGAVAIMPLASPIGSGLGMQSSLNIEFILEAITSIPVIVDAGVGTASDACEVMELGCDGVLMNSAVSCAKNPVLMARAMKHGIIAGREAFLAGRMPKRNYAVASTANEGKVGS